MASVGCSPSSTLTSSSGAALSAAFHTHHSSSSALAAPRGDCGAASATYSTAAAQRILIRHRSAALAPLRRLPVARSAHDLQTPYQCQPTPPSPADAADDAPAAPTYTAMRADPLAFWDSHPGILPKADSSIPNQGQGKADSSTATATATTAAQYNAVTNGRSQLLFEENIYVQSDTLSPFAAAELRLLTNAALDRAEMHSILVQQRDNWNKLFQRMLTSTTMTACVLSALMQNYGQDQCSLSLGLPAILLNAGSAAMMAIINQFQPSQLAEEQRTAVRLFRKLAGDIDYSLHVAPPLHQHTPSFLRDCRGRLQALDKAFPMPLTPGGLEKFPAQVVPPPLHSNTTQPHAESAIYHKQSGVFSTTTPTSDSNNGWDEPLIRNLQRVVALLDCSDIPKYTGWAQNLVKVNKCFAILAPLLAATAATLNAVVISTSASSMHLGMWAAVCSVLAAFVSSFSNDMQLGMVFELYRNSEGYYMDLKTSIEETLLMPIEQRENGVLFRRRIAYQLGRWPADADHSSDRHSSAVPLVPADADEAGMLF